MKEKILLTISILISDRPDTIRRCLDSLKPILENVPSELILTDTSGKAAIHEICLEYTDKVYEFEWCNDFAKARNLGLQKAKGEWFLFVDDDEWFVETDELVRFFCSGEYKQYDYAEHRLRNFLNVDYADSWVLRLFRLKAGAAFYGKVHEVFHPLEGARKELSALSYHSGYQFATKEEEEKHLERNTELLYEMLQSDPWNLHCRSQLLQEYAFSCVWEKMERLSRETIELIQDGKIEAIEYERCVFYSAYVYALGMLKRHEEAIAYIDKLLDSSDCLEELKWQLYYDYANDYFNLKQWREAETYAQIFLKLSKNSKNRKRVMNLQNRVMFLGDTFNPDRINRAWVILIFSNMRLGNTGILHEKYEKLPWDKVKYIAANDAISCMMEGIGELPYEPIFSRMLTDAYQNEALRPFIYLAVQGCRDKSEELYRHITYAFAQTDINEEYIWNARLQVANWECSAPQMQRILQEYFAKSMDVLKLAEDLEGLAQIYELDSYSNWQYTPQENWECSVDRFLGTAATDTILKITEQVRRIFEEECGKRLFYEMCLAKTELLGTHPEESYDELELRFYNYMVGALKYYLAIYPEEEFAGTMEALPPEARAAVFLNQFFGTSQMDWKMRLGLLRKCALEYPVLGQQVKGFVKRIAEQKEAEERERALEANVKLRQMVEMMKEKIRQLAEQGRNGEAMALLQQVRAIVPQDEELAELEGKEEIKNESSHFSGRIRNPNK